MDYFGMTDIDKINDTYYNDFLTTIKDLIASKEITHIVENLVIGLNSNKQITINSKKMLYDIRRFKLIKEYLINIMDIYDYSKHNDKLDEFYNLLSIIYLSCKDTHHTTEYLTVDIFASNHKLPIFDINTVVLNIQNNAISFDEITLLNKFVKSNGLDELIISIYDTKYGLTQQIPNGVTYVKNRQMIETPKLDFTNNIVIHDRTKFNSRFKEFTLGIFDELDDWTNITIAGGSIHNIISSFLVDFTKHSDVDIFIAGKDTSECRNTTLRILCYLDNQFKKHNYKVYYGVIRSVISIFVENHQRTFQIICNGAKSMSELITNFDFDHIKLAYTNNNVYGTYDAIVALKEWTVDITNKDQNTVRLYKILSKNMDVKNNSKMEIDCEKLLLDPKVEEYLNKHYYPVDTYTKSKNIYEIQIHYKLKLVSDKYMDCINQMKEEDFTFEKVMSNYEDSNKQPPIPKIALEVYKGKANFRNILHFNIFDRPYNIKFDKLKIISSDKQFDKLGDTKMVQLLVPIDSPLALTLWNINKQIYNTLDPLITNFPNYYHIVNPKFMTEVNNYLNYSTASSHFYGELIDNTIVNTLSKIKPSAITKSTFHPALRYQMQGWMKNNLILRLRINHEKLGITASNLSGKIKIQYGWIDKLSCTGTCGYKAEGFDIVVHDN
jgi:hypothetical protein